MRSIQEIEEDLYKEKKYVGYADGLKRYESACRIHDLTNELGIANKLIKKEG